jgi:hypothetical protein
MFIKVTIERMSRDCSLDLEPSSGLHWELGEPLRGGTWWEASVPGGHAFGRGSWDASLSLCFLAHEVSSFTPYPNVLSCHILKTARATDHELKPLRV